MISTPAIATMLECIGDVPTTYVHHDRRVTASEPLVTSSGVFKWQNVFTDAGTVTPELERGARIEATRLLESGEADAAYGMGLVVLHHSSAHDFLLIGSWRGHQEYWQTSLVRSANSDEPWTANVQGVISPVACVWEMSPIWHERQAWVRYLKSDRTVSDRQVWLDDTLTATM